MSWGHAASPAPQLIGGGGRKALLPSQELQSHTGASKEGLAWYPPQPQSSKWLCLTAGAARTPGQATYAEDRLSPRGPDLLATFPKQAPCSEAGGSSPRLQCGDKS